MSDATKIRETVSKAYTDAIREAAEASCTPSCCSSAPQASTLAEKIGYSEAELQSVPKDAATSSFGCGNPLAFADVKTGETVVDLGSGAGLDLLLAAQAVGPAGAVIGIDMTDEMIATARANIKREGAENVEVRKGLIEDLPVDDGSVDWVISNCVINLSPEKERVFQEIARVLKPGGTMQISDIVVNDLPDWARASQDLFTACVGGAISEEQYLQGLRDAGLTEPEVIGRVTYSAAQISSFLEIEGLPMTADDRNDLTGEQAGALAASLEGKVASLKIRAKKPVEAC